MCKVEILEPTSDYSPQDDKLVAEHTTTTSFEKFDTFNKNPFLKYLVSGSLIFMPPAQHESGMVKILPFGPIENYDKFLHEYADVVDSDINEYIKQINIVTHIDRFPKNEIIKEILSYKALNNNWDGYGAIPAEIESATNAILLIDLIGESIFSLVNEFYPNPNGTISFEWVNNSNEIFSLEVGNESMSYFIKLASQEPIFYNNKPVNAEEANKISECIRLL